MAENSELQVLQGHNYFSADVYKILAENEGNVFFSPISIHAVLSMVYQGAQGSTGRCFAETLKIPDAKTAAEGYNEVLKRLNSIENVTLLMANKIYLMKGCTLAANFEAAVTKYFLSEIQMVDFGDNTKAATIINDWVKEKTREKIQGIINKDDLNDLTRLVLVNAIYFKGNWKCPFDKDDTKREPFYLNNNDQVEVEMMHIKEKFYFKFDKDLNAKVLELPYTNNDLSMIIILPQERDGIGDLEKKLSAVDFNYITQKMRYLEINVGLPKFKIATTIDLVEPLSKLGLAEIFSPGQANFSGILEKSNENLLYVSKVIQKAFLEVNEEGSEAAAATAVCIMAECYVQGKPEIYFIADHPFILYLIQKRTILTPLFMGKITAP